MSNRAIWNVRLRHVWLQSPLKGKRQKHRGRARIGVQDALDRKKPDQQGDASADATGAAN